MPERPDDLQIARDIIQHAMDRIVEAGVPLGKLAITLGDAAVAVAYSGDNTFGPLDLVSYLSEQADEYEQNPPGEGEPEDDEADRDQDALNAAVLQHSLPDEMGEENEYQFSLIRNAMESLTLRQDMSIEEASASMVLYALGYLVLHRGIKAGEGLVAFAQDDLARLQSEPNGHAP